MKVLIVSATLPEIQPMMDSLRLKQGKNTVKEQEIVVLITGVGMAATAFSMGTALANTTYDLALNLGIAGSFDPALNLGEIVEISADTFSELGADDGERFIPLHELGFGKSTYMPIAFPFPLPHSLKKATAITVNKVHGEASSIKKTMDRLNPQTESMEGAAFFYACEQSKTPSLQVRAISNYIGPRDRDTWEVALAIKNLNTFAVHYISSLQAVPIEI